MKNFIVLLLISLSVVFDSYGNTAINEWRKKELSEEYKERLSDLSVIYGYIRYFYPNDNLKDFDWFKYLIYSTKEIENCTSETDFYHKLHELFSPLCPDISINDSVSTPNNIALSSFYVQEHRCENAKFISEIKKINEYTPRYPKPDSLYVFNISPNLTVSFPISLSKLPAPNDKLTKIKIDTKIFNVETGYNLFTEYQARIANEMIRYNIVQHFYPYYFEDDLHVTWKNSCKDFLGKVSSCDDMTNYYHLICSRMHLVKDSHVQIDFNILNGKNYAYAIIGYPEIATVIYDNKLFVKTIGSTYDKKVNKGDVITKINNTKTEDLIAEKFKYLSYSTLGNGLIKVSAQELFKSFKRDSVINLTVNNLRGEETVSVRTSSYKPYGIEDKNIIECFEGNIYYVNCKNAALTYKEFKKNISNINQSKGVVFDLRGYPNESVLSILANLTDTILSLGNLNTVYEYVPEHGKTYTIPVEKWFIAPSTSEMNKSYSKKYEYPLPASDRIITPYVFLINSESMSYMETVIDIIKHYHLGILIGEKTAGCNGDIVRLDLPFGSFTMTGAKYLNRDGSQHHGIGISPDIYVENQSLNTDKQLETSIQYLNDL
jgi:hypothetical protein